MAAPPQGPFPTGQLAYPKETIRVRAVGFVLEDLHAPWSAKGESETARDLKTAPVSILGEDASDVPAEAPVGVLPSAKARL